MPLKSIKYLFIFLLLMAIAMPENYAQRPKKAYKTGKTAFKNGEYMRAVGWLTLAIDAQKRQFDDAFIMRGKSYLKLDRKEKAVKDFIRASQLFPKKQEIALQTAQLLYDLEDYNKALKYATTTLNRESMNYEALKIQALSLAHTGNFESALMVCEDAAQIKEDAQLLYAKALASDSLGLKDYAIAYYNEAIDLNPSYKVPYHALGRLLAKKGYYNKAIEVFSQSAKQFNDQESYWLRSILYGKQGRTQSQISDITKILTLNPARVDLYFLRAQLYKKKNLLHNALSDINNYLKWDSISADAWMFKGKIQETLHMKNKAVDAFQKVLAYADDPAQKNQAEQYIFRLKKEQYPPQIYVVAPEGPDNSTITVGKAQNQTKIKGFVTDASHIDTIEVNSRLVDFIHKKEKFHFQTSIKIDTLENIQIRATDVYGNTAYKTYQILRAEKQPPRLYLQLPSLNADSSIVATKSQLTVKGFFAEQSSLKTVTIGGKLVDFEQREHNRYHFSDQIDILNIDTLVIGAEDYFSNNIIHRFPVILPDSTEEAGSPMGKTWVVLIAADSIRHQKLPPVAALKDTLLKALSFFKIDSTILLEGTTKEVIERKLLFELPRATSNDRVNALMIYYIGAGISENGFTYWIVNTDNPDQKYGKLNTALFSTVFEAMESVRYKNVISESVALNKNIVENKDTCRIQPCEKIQSFPDRGQLTVGIKVENWHQYHSPVAAILQKTIEQRTRCFSPISLQNMEMPRVSFGTFINNAEKAFPVILYLNTAKVNAKGR